LRLYNTASQDFVDISRLKDVRIYVCGITPYDSAHIGHAFTFLTYDILRRHLENRGVNVNLVRNITDVDEPMYPKAKSLNVSYLELAEQQTAEFSHAMDALNLLKPDAEPRPSHHIDDIAESVGQLLTDQYAYKLDGDIYFDIEKSKAFGEVSHYSPALMKTFAGARGTDIDRTAKRNPLDFLLWRRVDDPSDPAAWETEIGYGRPGWHIECSVMSYKYLGSYIDIHGGGTDLIFPHHECENAQSQALGRTPFVGTWMHTAPMLLGGDKMSKSLGNLVFVRDIIEHVEPAAVRLALMSYHYRSGGEWRQDVLRESTRLLDMIRHALSNSDGADLRPLRAQIEAALDNDLDVPTALSALRDMTKSVLLGGSDTEAPAQLASALDLLGIDVSNR
jgi:L-cysteine:1D-myo-inositol 2-amino-2-deoxy-alpha-D-glucopyranoside ligase